jgi:hypothetical protein
MALVCLVISYTMAIQRQVFFLHAPLFPPQQVNGLPTPPAKPVGDPRSQRKGPPLIVVLQHKQFRERITLRSFLPISRS